MEQYPKAIDTVAEWIAQGAELEIGSTLFSEPTLPDGPDKIASVFENGGTWDTDTNQLTIRLAVLCRSSTLADAREFIVAVTKAALDGFKSSGQPRQGNIVSLSVASTPVNQGRDESNRVVLLAALDVLCTQPE